MISSPFLLAGLWATQAHAHFVITYPETIAKLNDVTENAAPCGGADIKAPAASLVDWPVAGSPIGWQTTHPTAKYHFRASLASDTTKWKDLAPIVNQATGLGNACLTSIPGVAAWVGQAAVVQVHQLAPDGSLYQCMAVKFTSDPAAPLPPDHHACMNSTGLSLAFETTPSSTTGGNPPSGTMTTAPDGHTHSHEASAVASPTASPTTSPAASKPAAAGRVDAWSTGAIWAVGTALLAAVLS